MLNLVLRTTELEAHFADNKDEIYVEVLHMIQSIQSKTDPNESPSYVN